MKTSDFDYDLPPELIAQHPAEHRDSSRMMVLDRASSGVEHRLFSDFPSLLRPGDTLVLNDTKVIPARLYGSKATGARVEVFLLYPEGTDIWRCLVNPGRKVRVGDGINFGDVLTGHIIDRHESGTRSVRFEYEGDFQAALSKVGQVPLPPYIKRDHEMPEDRERYQTIYAAQPGAVAAPTAGLHFTPETINTIENNDVSIACITLHVGLGTFKPVTVDDVSEHRMDSEWYEINRETADVINATRGRVVAVGTTCVRTLESAWNAERGTMESGSAWTEKFITPGYRFKRVDALLTNFHLPRSTLIMLVSAFAGRERVLDAYNEAIRQGYRFYSYGDCMFIP